MADRGKPRKPLQSKRAWSLEGPTYEEQRGLRSLEFDLHEKRPEPPSALAKKMIEAATQQIAEAGEKSLETILAGASTDEELDQALAVWTAGITLKHGFFSPVTLAARLLGQNASLTRRMTAIIVAEENCSAEDVAPEDQIVRMRQVYEFADAWHWLHMETFGEHDLAFARQQHAAGTAKGSAATAEKAAKRARIIAAAVDAVRKAGVVDMANTSAVAREIRPIVDDECAKAGLPKAQSMASFIKAVASALKAGKG